MEAVQVASLQKGDYFTVEGSENVYQVGGTYKNEVFAQLMCRHNRDAATSLTINQQDTVCSLSGEEYHSHSGHPGWTDPRKLEEQAKEDRKGRTRVLIFLSALLVILLSIFWSLAFGNYSLKGSLLGLPVWTALFGGSILSDCAKSTKQAFLFVAGGCLVAILMVYLQFGPLHDVLNSWVNS